MFIKFKIYLIQQSYHFLDSDLVFLLFIYMRHTPVVKLKQ